MNCDPINYKQNCWLEAGGGSDNILNYVLEFHKSTKLLLLIYCQKNGLGSCSIKNSFQLKVLAGSPKTLERIYGSENDAPKPEIGKQSGKLKNSNP